MKDVVQDIKSIKREHKSINEGTARMILDEYKSVHNNPRRPKLVLWSIAGASLIALFFALSFLFAGATVTVTPKVVASTVDGNWTATKDSTGDALAFQVVSLTGEESANLPATGTKQVEQAATGTVTIYNSYSSASQQLLINTRLETPDGKIYKIDKAVTVPGMTTKNGAKVNGAVTVTAHASAGGEDYNIGLSDFTIPGFKGDPRFAKFFARSVTPMSGGAKGNLNFVSLADAQKTQDGLTSVLKDKLLKQALAQTPNGFIVFDDSVFLKPETVTPNMYSKTNLVTVTQKGTLYAFLFDEKKLVKNITQSSISQFDGSGVVIPDLNKLKFVLKNKDAIDPITAKDISFSLTGQANIVWVVDQAKLAGDLSGKSKKDFKDILSNYESIDKAEVAFKPFWRSKFPDDSKKIKIIDTIIK